MFTMTVTAMDNSGRQTTQQGTNAMEVMAAVCEHFGWENEDLVLAVDALEQIVWAYTRGSTSVDVECGLLGGCGFRFQFQANVKEITWTPR